MSLPPTPKTAEVVVPVHIPEVANPESAGPPPAEPDDSQRTGLESPDPFAPSKTRVYTFRPPRTVVHVTRNDTGKEQGAERSTTPTPTSDRPAYSVLLLRPVPPRFPIGKHTAVYSTVTISKPNRRQEKIIRPGDDLHWDILLWDPHKSVHTYWHLTEGGTAWEKREIRSDPPIDQGGIVCGHISTAYADAVQFIDQESKGCLWVGISSWQWASNLVDNISASSRVQMQTARIDVTWVKECGLLAALLADETLKREGEAITGAGLIASEGYVLVDQFFIAMRLRWLPNTFPPSTLSYSALPRQDEVSYCLGPAAFQKTGLVVLLSPLLIPTTSSLNADVKMEVVWQLVLVNYNRDYSYVYSYRLDRGPYPVRYKPTAEEISEAPGGIHIGICHHGKEPDVDRTFMQTKRRADTREWAFKVLHNAVEEKLLLCPDGQSPLTLEWVDGFSLYFRDALQSSVVTKAGKEGEILDAISRKAGELFDEYYLNLDRLAQLQTDTKEIRRT